LHVTVGTVTKIKSGLMAAVLFRNSFSWLVSGKITCNAE